MKTTFIERPPDQSRIVMAIARLLPAEFIKKIALAIVFSVVVVSLFNIIFYKDYIKVRKFPDYGPTLFSGGQPNILLWLYIVLVVSATGIGWLLTALSARSSLGDRLRRNSQYDVGLITIALMILTVTMTAIVTGDMQTEHYRTSLLLLGGTFLGVGVSSISIQKIETGGVSIILHFARRLPKTEQKFAEYAKFIFILIFIVIAVFHMPKIPVLYGMAVQASMVKESVGLFLALLFGSAGIGYLLANSPLPSKRLTLSLILSSIYLISIRESWIYWDVDAFHEGESFLTANLLLNGPYKFLEDFFPVHGMGRNILHGYYAGIFSDYNLYFYRIIQALTYPFIHVLIAAFLYRYTRKLFVPMTFFVISYLFGFVEERDISPFFLMALLLIPLKIKKSDIPLKIAAGIMLFLESIFSLEFFVLLNIAMAVTFICRLYLQIRSRRFNIPWMYVSYYGGLLAALFLLGSGFSHWLSAVRNALTKSPNLLERSLEARESFSFLPFSLSSFFAVFLLFHLVNSVAFLRGSRRMISDKNMLVVIFSLVSLMFFTRAFNRSDIAHVVYAYSASLPVIVGFALRYKYIRGQDFLLGSLALVIFLGATYAQKGSFSMNILSQRPIYDERLTRGDVRPLQNFGAIQVPSGTVSDDSHMTQAELNELQSMVRDGYKIFDMSNQPVLIYGAVKSPLVTNDIHTLFYNTYGEQVAVIEKLKFSGNKTIVLWSAGYWTETLDYTYMEYRLPILSEYINTAYRFAYRVGRFTILSDQPLLGKTALTSGIGREQYDLGFAPSRMEPYKQESVSTLASFSADRTSIKGLTPDAIAIDVFAAEKGPIYLQLLSNGLPVCTVTFSVLEGASVNFIRLANLPAYRHSEPTELTVRAGNSNVRVDEVRLLALTKKDGI